MDIFCSTGHFVILSALLGTDKGSVRTGLIGPPQGTLPTHPHNTWETRGGHRKGLLRP